MLSKQSLKMPCMYFSLFNVKYDFQVYRSRDPNENIDLLCHKNIT